MRHEQHNQQAEQFLAFNEKRGGEWRDNYAVWSNSKKLTRLDHYLIRQVVMEVFASRGVVPSEMEQAS